ncbi:MAG TPA: hypothetical protein VHZ24_14680 [Pirellulales bacterium]|jgi:hypothetical protein|nr:hypothetical protein [Pirellulales bacterium]
MTFDRWLWLIVWQCALAISVGVAVAAEPEPATVDGLPLVFADDFEHGADHWQPTDPEAWKIVEVATSSGSGAGGSSGSGHAYCLFQQSKYKPPHRSPFNFALVQDVKVADFVFDARVLSTKPDYNHRDMCLVFGYQDPAHFYYVHLGKKTDDHANQIFIVNNAPRVKISTKTTPGTNWDDQWHQVRIVRKTESGSIDVYFDDLDKPVMHALDKTFLWGQVGVGSFDDIGDWDDVRLYGTIAKP